MCFKKPKPPEKTAEDIAAEKELEEMRKIRQAQLNEELSESKQARIEEAIARSQGLMGNRSLLRGGRGGSGFLGRNTRGNVQGAARSGSIAPSAPPIMGGGPSLFSSVGGASGGGAGGIGRVVTGSGYQAY